MVDAPGQAEWEGEPGDPMGDRVQDMLTDAAECARYVREVAPDEVERVVGRLMAEGLTACAMSAKWGADLDQLRCCMRDWAYQQVVA